MNLLKAILIFAFLGCSSGLAAQSLSFSQVITYRLNPGTPQAFTVPAGKVWKVESVGLNFQGSAYIHLRDGSGNNISCLQYNDSGVNKHELTKLPLWLDPSFNGQFISSGSTNAYGIVSIIEFNVIP